MSVSERPHATEIVHVAGPRPTPRELLREVVDVLTTVPLFVFAPLLRHWHRHWA